MTTTVWYTTEMWQLHNFVNYRHFDFFLSLLHSHYLAALVRGYADSSMSSNSGVLAIRSVTEGGNASPKIITIIVSVSGDQTIGLTKIGFTYNLEDWDIFTL